MLSLANLLDAIARESARCYRSRICSTVSLAILLDGVARFRRGSALTK
jgi:hypothetical protein